MENISGFKRIFFAPIMFWIVVLFAGLYFMIGIDRSIYNSAQKESGVVGYIKHVTGSLKLSNINKGIDLAGGVYLVLSVEIEKAIENRLGLEFRSLDQLFTDKGLKNLPKDKKIEAESATLKFEDEITAKDCYDLLAQERSYIFKAKRSGSIISLSLVPHVVASIKTGAVEQAVNVLTNRLNNYGVESIIVQRHGERRIVIQMPGVDDADRIKRVVMKTALLEFKLVEDKGSSKEKLLDKFDGELPSDKIIISGQGEHRNEWFIVSAYPDMTGDRVVDAFVKLDGSNFNQPVVGFRLDGIGAKEFGELTGKNVGRNLGIIIDNVMYSSPNIQCEIPGGEGIITTSGKQKEAVDLSIVLKSGALQAPLKFEQESIVGSSLGRDAVNKGVMSCIVALLMLFVFSLFYYRIPGLFAILALLYNLFLVMFCLAYFNATLTLPGIAGMVVTIGMAIDASILIFEKIKEELSNGESMRISVDKGFKSAMVVILDSNITTFLTGLVLFQFGGPAIKGFAITLMIGIIATILAGVYFMKSLFSFTLDSLGVIKLKI